MLTQIRCPQNVASDQGLHCLPHCPAVFTILDGSKIDLYKCENKYDIL